MVEIVDERNQSTVIRPTTPAPTDIEYASIQLKSRHERGRVTKAYIIALAFNFFILVFVLLAVEIQEPPSGGKSEVVGWVVLIFVSASTVFLPTP